MKVFFSSEAKQSLSHSLRYVMHCTFSQAHHKHIECLYVPSPFKYKIHERTHNRLSDYIAIVMITDVSAVLFCICKRLWKRYMRTKRVGVCICGGCSHVCVALCEFQYLHMMLPSKIQNTILVYTRRAVQRVRFIS